MLHEFFSFHPAFGKFSDVCLISKLSARLYEIAQLTIDCFVLSPISILFNLKREHILLKREHSMHLPCNTFFDVLIYNV